MLLQAIATKRWEQVAESQRHLKTTKVCHTDDLANECKDFQDSQRRRWLVLTKKKNNYVFAIFESDCLSTLPILVLPIISYRKVPPFVRLPYSQNFARPLRFNRRKLSQTFSTRTSTSGVRKVNNLANVQRTTASLTPSRRFLVMNLDNPVTVTSNLAKHYLAIYKADNYYVWKQRRPGSATVEPHAQMAGFLTPSMEAKNHVSENC